MIKGGILIFVMAMSLSAIAGPDKNKKMEASVEKLVFRQPFTLKIRVDKERYYENRFDKIPYVVDNSILLFAGENFGVKISINKGEITEVTYTKDVANADVELNFSQKADKDGEVMMALSIKNKLKQRLYLNALMTVPGEKGTKKTSILPVEPGLTNYESWPHPIIQLALIDLRLKPET
jgi:hypothetical protein